MTDRWDDFDCALATSLSELPPPEETVRAVTPFRTAMGKVTAGLCLTCFTLSLSLILGNVLEANAGWAYGMTEDEVRAAFSLITAEWTAGDN